MNDAALKELSPLLKEIAIKQVKDIRQALRNLRDQMIKQIQEGVPNPHLNLKLE
jgi:CTD small phosphatase-like protein 2